jgi:hypothetical protein
MSAPTSGARLPAAETRSASVAHSKLRRREHHTRMPAIRPGAAILRMELLCHEASGTDDPGRHDCILARPAQSAQRLGQGLHSGAGFLTGLATERWTLSASRRSLRRGARLPRRSAPRESSARLPSACGAGARGTVGLGLSLMGVGTGSRWAPGVSDLEPQEAGRGRLSPPPGTCCAPGRFLASDCSRNFWGHGGPPNASARVPSPPAARLVSRPPQMAGCTRGGQQWVMPDPSWPRFASLVRVDTGKQ